jgi:hypothetical protein
MGGAIAGASGAAAVIAEAIKASGAIVRVEPSEFAKLLDRSGEGLVVHAQGGFLSTRHRYLMGYRGLVFTTSTAERITLPGSCEVIEAGKIWIPG